MISATVSPSTITVGETAELKLHLANTGDGPCSRIILSIQIPPGLLLIGGRNRIEVEQLGPGQVKTTSMIMRSDRAGSYELTSGNFSFCGPNGIVTRRSNFSAVITADPPKAHPQPTRKASPSARPASRATPPARALSWPVRILFLAANPLDTTRLRIDEETRQIQDTIRAGRERDRVDFHARLAIRAPDISQALLDLRPQIAHFAGHGGGLEGSFAAETQYGNAHLLRPEGLTQIFKVAGRTVRCVIVNACETEQLARTLSSVVPYVIGMRTRIGDGSAIGFSVGFYQALAAGLTIEDAFDLGEAQLSLTPDSEGQRPLLFRRGQLIRPTS